MMTKSSLPLIVLCLLFITVTGAYSKAQITPLSELEPLEKHARATQVINRIIDAHHYRKRAVDDALSSTIFDNYMKSLDPNRSFFSADDVRLFERYRYKLDDAVRRSDLEPAFEIFKLYRVRVKERMDYAIARLDGHFDFEVDENYVFDRRDLDWATNIEALNELWRKRIKNDMLNLLLTGKEESAIKETLKKRYRKIYTNAFQLGANDVFQAFVNAYTTSIEPHTSYFSPRASENFDINMRLSLEGIGAVLRSANDYTVIHEIVPGGPADLSGALHRKDKIIGVAEGEHGSMIDVIGWRLDDVVQLIRGAKGTVVRLEVIPSEAATDDIRSNITLIRDKIKLEKQAAQSDVINLPTFNKKIGVIDVPTFYVDFAKREECYKRQSRQEHCEYRSTSGDVRKLIAALVTGERVNGIVIDLRGNGGGALDEALALTGLFIAEGPVVQTRNSHGKISTSHDPDPGLFYAGPLAVLVDRDSASASEIFAGAIQDYERGIVIGEPTYGKGTVQNIIDLNGSIKNTGTDHGKLKITIAQFYRISGGSNQSKGVVPDIIFPTASDVDDYGERALENAIPWDRIDPAPYIKVSAPKRFYPEVRTLHEVRVRSDRAFALLLEQHDLFKKNAQKKSASLKKNRRKAERDQIRNTKDALENELRVAQGLPLSLKQGETDTDEADPNAPHDLLLHESARVLSDLIILPEKASKLQADKH